MQIRKIHSFVHLNFFPLDDIDYGIFVCAGWASLRILETLLLSFSHTAVSSVYTEWTAEDQVTLFQSLAVQIW